MGISSMMDEIMTLAEAAAELGLSPDTLRRQAQRGVLEARLIGKTWVTTRRAVDDYRRQSLGQPGRRPKD
jgi:excisionase family DNA binding protein